DPYAPPVADADVAPEATDLLEPADRGLRFGAALIDGLLLVGAALPGIFLALGNGDAISRMMLFFPVLALLGVQWYLIATRGQSLAKGWLRIRIIKMDGSPCGFVNGVLLRVWVTQGIAYAASYALGMSGLNLRINPFAIIDALFIFGADRRCLHDLVAGTRVV